MVKLGESDGRRPELPGRPERSDTSRARPRLAWHHAAVEEVSVYWQSDVTRGLSQAAASDRLLKLGANRLPEPKPEGLLTKLIAQVSDFTVLALLGAAAIAAGLGVFASPPGARWLERFGDAAAILAIVIVNAVLGLLQARKAERAMSALRGMTAPTARVMRDGQIEEIAATELVPGDLILLEDGDRIPADVRLSEAFDLEVEEAALTGESMPVAKESGAVLERDAALAERRTMVFMGTRIRRGRGRGMVANTGLHTELGAIAGMLERVPVERTPLEDDLERFGKRVVLACVAVSLVVFGAGLLFSHSSPRELFLIAVALAVAAIPEGLPAVTTIVLALGTTRMAKRHALVRRLPAVETLGCAQIICTDKTGTLTQNKMTVRRVLAAGNSVEIPESGAVQLQDGASDLLEAASFASGAQLNRSDLTTQGDPTDGAMLVLAARAGVVAPKKILGEQPFSSSRRMASILIEHERGARALVRGAPEAILEQCRDADREAILKIAASWAEKAMRVIALGRRDFSSADAAKTPGDWESQLTFVGLVGIIDPPRPEVAAAIAEAKLAGIRTVMITGDHPATARAIAEEIGLIAADDRQALVLSGRDLDQLEQQSLEDRIDRVCVVARATAEHKLRIVHALRARGFVCAMTGDGVNDAPAVKAASIGIAMGKTGTDVTKEAAALVLSDDNYATIIAAVEEGRAIYSNIRKFIFFLLSSNAGCVIFVLAAALAGWEAPLAPIQILWINLITNGLPALALGLEPRDPLQMNRPPREPGGAILTRREYIEIGLVGAVMAFTAVVAFLHALPDPHHSPSPERLAHARTMVFALLSFGPLFHALNCRSERRSIFDLGLFTNRSLWGAIFAGGALQLIVIYLPWFRPIFKTAPLDGTDLIWLTALSLLPVILGELLKWVLRRVEPAT